MASSNYTPNLGLNSWAAGDRPKRADFVSDNGIIDEVLGGHVNDTDLHMTAAEKAKALTPYECYVYAGSGESSRTIQVSFRPTFALVYKKNAPPVNLSAGTVVVNSGYASYGQGGSDGVSISSTGVVVRQEAAASNGKRISLNEEDCQYTLVAFK